jgi:hypothetical protein
MSHTGIANAVHVVREKDTLYGNIPVIFVESCGGGGEGKGVKLLSTPLGDPYEETGDRDILCNMEMISPKEVVVMATETCR